MTVFKNTIVLFACGIVLPLTLCAISLAAKAAQQPVSESQQQAQRLISKMLEINRYWLVRPPDVVKDYSYTLNVVVTNSKPFKPSEIVIKDPKNALPTERYGIGYYSVLQELGYEPNNITVTQIADENGLTRVDIKASQKKIAYVYGNGLKHGYFGSMGGGSVPQDCNVTTDFSVWIDLKTMVPRKVKLSGIEERFDEYVNVDDGHLVPLRITVDNDFMHFEFKFCLIEPGLWLFDQSGYNLQRDTKTRVTPLVALTKNIIVNGQEISKPGPAVRQSQFAITEDEGIIQKSTSQLSLEFMGSVLTKGKERKAPFPKSLDELQVLKDVAEGWSQRITYIGGTLKSSQIQKAVLAYDRLLPKYMAGTNVLFDDGSVEFLNIHQLQELGIKIE